MPQMSRPTASQSTLTRNRRPVGQRTQNARKEHSMSREDMANSVKVKSKTSFDYTIFFIVLFLFAFGMVMITSISPYNATKYYDDALLFVKNQAKYGLIGIVAMIGLGIKLPIFNKFNYQLLKVRIKIASIRLPLTIMAVGYFLVIGLQLFVLLKGHSMNGSARWLDIAGFRFQPSELAKIFVVVYAAFLAQKRPKSLDNPLKFLYYAVIISPIIVLVAKENLSTGIVIGLIFAGIFFVTSRKWWYFIAFGLVAAAGVWKNIASTGYRSERIDKWLNVETAKDAYQILQGLYALVSGGFWGKGLGNSIQKLGYIPEVHTDMIFSCIVEELGLFGALLLMAMYIYLLVRILLVAYHAPDLFGSLICVGVFIQLAAQIVINIAVVTNTMPATGVPLPFISYGGSSLIFSMLEIGLVLNVSRRIEYQDE